MIKKIIQSALIFACLLFNTNIVLSQTKPHNELYKWKDSSGSWHYSKNPPIIEKLGSKPQDLESAKNAATIIFSVKPIVQQEIPQETPEQLLKKKQMKCYTSQRDIMYFTNYLHIKIDKSLKDKQINLQDYVAQLALITKLEDIGGDVDYVEKCVDDFKENPKLKPLQSCIVEKGSDEDRLECMKLIP